MAHHVDWIGSNRTEILAKAKNWATLMAANYTRWKIPQNVVTEMGLYATAAGEALENAQNEATRTPVATARCKAAFDELVAAMRDIKRRYFLQPPLTDADFVSLGIPLRDTVRTPVPPPTAQPTADVSFPGLHLVMLTRIRSAGAPSENSESDYGTRIYYGFTGPVTKLHEYRLSERPELGSQLPYSAFTRRDKHRFDFEGESGNTMYLCMRYENGKGEAGPFGPMMQFSIP